MILRKKIISIFLIAELLALPVAVHSFNLVDFALDNDIEFTDENGQCSSINLGNIIDQYSGDLEAQISARVEKAFTDAFAKYWKDLLLSVLGSLLGTGTGVSGAKPAIKDIGGAALEDAKLKYEREYRENIVTDCTTQSDIRAILNATRNVLSDNGRDGGAVYVRNWRSFQSDNRYRGLEIARNEMANTNHCLWLRGELQQSFGFNYANAVPQQRGNEDGRNSYVHNAQCGLADNFNPFAPINQTTGAIAALLGDPRNWNGGAYMLAQDEVNRQIGDEEQASENEFVHTGGFGALREINNATGNSCAVMSANGTCLEYTTITNPAGGVLAEVNAERQALHDLITNPVLTDQVVNDVRENVVGTFMNINKPLAQLQYKRGGTSGSSTPRPSIPPTDVPGSGAEDDPVCTGNVPSCKCATNDNAAQGMASGPVLNATREAIREHPEMVTPDGVSVLPGQNLPFLRAVCESDQLTALEHCRPNNAGLGLVLSFGVDLNVDVILPSSVIRQPGQVTLVCTEPGRM